MSIDPREFRLGNWVSFRGQYAQISAIYNSDERMADAIPLTSELLLKCGFEKHKNSNEYWNQWVLENGWHISEWVNDKPMAGFEEKGVCYWGDNFIPIKFLHRLQNLYFELTNSELTITL